MAEYIDRVDAIKAVNEQNALTMTRAALIDVLNGIPAADVTPVVHCKGCKHYDLGVCLKIYSNGNAHPEAWQSRKPEDFCSYGERKDKADAEGLRVQ